MYRIFLTFFLSGLFFSSLNGQDTLPHFKLLPKGNNKIILSWVNLYGSGVKQLSIQRSMESSRNFRTILTLPDPTVRQNGYVDTKLPGQQLFYRLYILLDSGKYVFSKVKRSFLDTSKTVTTFNAGGELTVINDKKNSSDFNIFNSPSSATSKRMIHIKRRDTLIAHIEERFVKQYKDSITLSTKDTILVYTVDTLVIRPYVFKEVFKPSKYVFTNKEGMVKIVLPDAATKKYTVQFFDERDAPVFEIKLITSQNLTLDKANFLHAGWFRFELYEDTHLKEKNKVFVIKEIR